jgi:hypothetical protein
MAERNNDGDIVAFLSVDTFHLTTITIADETKMRTKRDYALRAEKLAFKSAEAFHTPSKPNKKGGEEPKPLSSEVSVKTLLFKTARTHTRCWF